jgi:hypothetical protein
VLLIVAAFVLFLVPVAAIAAGGFTDVEEDSVFKADIAWLADAGVTQGCNPPSNDRFCPGSNVTREQMAAFMHRLATNQVVDAKTALTAGHAAEADVAAVAGNAANADKLDGKDSTAFAVSGHDHDTDYLAKTGKADDSDLLDGKDSTAFVEHGEIVMTTSGNAWFAHGKYADVTPFERWATETTFFVPVRAVISLTGPSSIDGVEYGLGSFDLCVITDSNYVSSVSVTGIASFGSDVDDDQYLSLFHEAFASPGLTTGCHTFDVNAPVGQGAGLMVEIADISDGSPVTLSSVRSVWTPEAAQA